MEPMTFAPINPLPSGREEDSHSGSGLAVPAEGRVQTSLPLREHGESNHISKGRPSACIRTETADNSTAAGNIYLKKAFIMSNVHLDKFRKLIFIVKLQEF